MYAIASRVPQQPVWHGKYKWPSNTVTKCTPQSSEDTYFISCYENYMLCLYETYSELYYQDYLHVHIPYPLYARVWHKHSELGLLLCCTYQQTVYIFQVQNNFTLLYQHKFEEGVWNIDIHDSYLLLHFGIQTDPERGSYYDDSWLKVYNWRENNEFVYEQTNLHEISFISIRFPIIIAMSYDVHTYVVNMVEKSIQQSSISYSDAWGSCYVHAQNDEYLVRVSKVLSNATIKVYLYARTTGSLKRTIALAPCEDAHTYHVMCHSDYLVAISKSRICYCNLRDPDSQVQTLLVESCGEYSSWTCAKWQHTLFYKQRVAAFCDVAFL